MGVLQNVAIYAKDTAVGGFRDCALAALVYQARLAITNPPIIAGSNPPTIDTKQVSFAKSILRDATAWADSAAWVAATDPAVRVLVKPVDVATQNALDNAVLAALAVAWQTLSHLDSYTG